MVVRYDLGVISRLGLGGTRRGANRLSRRPAKFVSRGHMKSCTVSATIPYVDLWFQPLIAVFWVLDGRRKVRFWPADETRSLLWLNGTLGSSDLCGLVRF